MNHLKEAQIETEQRFSKSALRQLVREDLQGCEELNDRMYMCRQIILEWAAHDHYETKNNRLVHLTADIVDSVMLDIMAAVSTVPRVQEMTAIVASCTGGLRVFDEADVDDPYIAMITTVAEIAAIMGKYDLIKVFAPHESPIYRQVKTNDGERGVQVMAVAPMYALDEITSLYINEAIHILPMICKPQVVKHNSQSAYYVDKKPIILKPHLNMHDERISLDVINIFNSNEYCIDVDFLSNVQDILTPSKKKAKDTPITEDQLADWQQHQEQCTHVFNYLIDNGNKFHLTHHFDSVGRLYSRGYHINPQGKAYKKAMVSFAEALPIEVSDSDIALFS